MSYYLAIDLGGTSIKLALFDSLDKPSILRKVVFSNPGNYADYLEKIVSFVEGRNLKAVGVSTTGGLNQEKTIIVGASDHTPQLQDATLVDDLRSNLNCSIFMDNDAICACYGEKLFGGNNLDEFTYLIWGSGIGGAIVKKTVSIIDWDKYFQEWEVDCAGNLLPGIYGKKAEQLSDAQWKKIMTAFEKHFNQFAKMTQTKNVVFGGGVAINQFSRVKKMKTPVKLFLSTFKEDAGLFGALALIKIND